jgi:ketosteroid isomerase-like protein
MLIKLTILLIFSFFILSCGQNKKVNETGDKMDSQTKITIETINKFNTAFNLHDVDTIMTLMTEDCVFENTRPVPDGERFEGQEKVRAFWTQMFDRSPKARFETEEIIAAGDRCIVRWIYHWVKDDKEGHIRGVDIFKVKDGKVAEKFSYVKG